MSTAACRATPLICLCLSACVSEERASLSGIADGSEVRLICRAGLVASSAIDESGVFRVTVPARALPCAVRLVATTPLHSIALREGELHINWLTDLTLFLATSGNPSGWYATLSDETLLQVRQNLTGAIHALHEALEAAGYDVPGRFDPFAEDFPDLTTALRASLNHAGRGYEDFVSATALSSQLMLPPFVYGEALTSRAEANPELMRTGRAVYSAQNGGGESPFVEGQQVALYVGPDSALTIAGRRLVQPFVRTVAGVQFTAEIIWHDKSSGIDYALTDNDTGVLTHVTLSRGDALIGTLRPVAAATETTLSSAFAGTFPRSYVYAGKPTWTSVTLGEDASVSFIGAGPSFGAQDVDHVVSDLDCCGRVSIFSNGDLNGDGTIDELDRVVLYRDDRGRLKDVEYCDASGQWHGATVGERPPLPPTTIGPVLEGNEIRGTIAGSARTTPALCLAEPDGATVVSGSSALTVWEIRVLAPSPLTPGTYDCSARFAEGSLALSTSAGGRCIVHVLAADTAIEGSFVAEMFPDKRDLAPVVVDDGMFRATP